MRDAPGIKEAERMRKRYGFKPYSGATLEGPRSVLCRGDVAYPNALRRISNPPEKLYVIGDASALVDGLAVVGARKATPYGIACASNFSRLAAARGIPIISGGALGCDSAAHKAALAASGKTVVFLGGGCDQIYPASNQRLFQDIVFAGGAVVSENEWDFPALPYTFRQRNRLIAGLARATLIVEAGLPSGTFSTADEALAASKDVLVVPGAITSATSAGSNRLLYQGATPIVDEETFDDVLCGLFGLLRQECCPAEGHGSAETGKDPLLSALLANPLRIDEIMALDIGKKQGGPDRAAYLNLHLSELEASGEIARFPDGRYGPAKV